MHNNQRIADNKKTREQKSQLIFPGTAFTFSQGPQTLLIGVVFGAFLFLKQTTEVPMNLRQSGRILRGFVVSLFILMTLSCSNSWAEISTDIAVRAILGEAENQGYEGMVALGEALRNRGKLSGVYGYRAILVKDGVYFRKSKKGLRRIEPGIVAKSHQAWVDSMKSDLVKQADHWENTKAFGVPAWSKGMTHTATIGDHSFYKEAI